MVAFFGITLVDTDGIDPEPSHLVLESEVLECQGKLPLHLEFVCVVAVFNLHSVPRFVGAQHHESAS